MLETQPIERPDRGHADEKADQILGAYFESQGQETADDSGEQKRKDDDSAGDNLQSQPEPPVADQAAPTGEDGNTEGQGDGEAESQKYYVADLADHFDVDQSALWNTLMRMDDGTDLSIGQLKNEVQDARRSLGKMEQEKQQLQFAAQQLQRQQQELAARQSMYSMQPDEEEQRLHNDLIMYQRAEQDRAYWDQQAQRDPGATALALNRLQSQRAETERKLQAKQSEREGKSQEKQKELMAMSQREIAERIPDWRDGQKVQQDWGEIQQLWSRFGLDQSAIETLWQSPPAMHLSHTFLQLLRKLNNADPAKKKVVPIKGLKSGKPAGTKPKNQQLEALRKSALKGNRKAQDALASDLLKDYL